MSRHLNRHTVLCAAPRVAGGHWSVGGHYPTFRDPAYDEYTACLHWTAPDGSYRIHTALRLFCDAGNEAGRDRMRQIMLERGYLVVHHRRAGETPERTYTRRLRVYRRRRNEGLPASIPNDPRHGHWPKEA